MTMTFDEGLEIETKTLNRDLETKCMTLCKGPEIETMALQKGFGSNNKWQKMPDTTEREIVLLVYWIQSMPVLPFSIKKTPKSNN